MKQKSVTFDKQKAIIVNVLYAGSMVIIFLGLFFSIFSIVNHISFKILNNSVPGAVFGILVIYLGIKYYFSVIKLKPEVYKDSSKFSWSNFKRKNNKKFIFKK